MSEQQRPRQRHASQDVRRHDGPAKLPGLTRAATEIRVHVALDSIQEALRLIEQATQALCRVDGLIPERRRIGSLCDQLTQTWYAVSAGANRLRRHGYLRVD